MIWTRLQRTTHVLDLRKMKFSYKFSNLYGAVYRRGNVEFTSDGDCVVSPVGNRVSVFDLKNNRSWTLPFENSCNVARICLSPDDSMIIIVDEGGRCLVANLKAKIVLHSFNFKNPVCDIKFSPNGRYIAVTHGKQIQVWHAPGHTKEFAPFVLHRTYTGHFDDNTCIDWSADSRFFVSGSEDMTAKVNSVHPMNGFTPVTLTGHRSVIAGCFFEEKSMDVYTVSQDGALYIWKCNTALGEIKQKLKDKKDESVEEDKAVDGDPSQNDSSETDIEAQIKYAKQAKHFFNEGEVSSCALHKPSHILIVGFQHGMFSLYEVPDFNKIHSLSISQHKITAVSVNPTGEWLAFGCASVGQLLVWEWQSETYILKQQGHYYDMNDLAYSPDGMYIATGGDDGKVKLWNTLSGFCFVTFHEHTGGITGVVFTPNGQAVLSSSLDGTVRAFDLNRYRNFRTFTSPRPAQFSCLALDSSGEIVCAGSLDTFEIFVWSVQMGRLLEVLAGQEGPVSSLSFSPTQAMLVSGSWDKTIKFWEVFESRGVRETLPLTSDVVAVAFRPDGKEVAVSTLDGQITFWDVRSAVQVKSIEGRRDIGYGRRSSDKVTAKATASGKCFTSLCYTADGECVLAGGRSKFVCIYHVWQQVLVKRFEISRNMSLDGMKQFLNSKYMTEFGPLDEIDDDSDREDISLPGVLKGDMSSRKTRPEIRVKCVKFSPTGRSWAAVSTEGLMMYSLDASLVFDPYDLDPNVTPSAIRDVCTRGEYARAIVLSFRLNEKDLIREVVESVKAQDIQLIVQCLSEGYVDKMLDFVATQLEGSKHLEFYLMWCSHLLTVHGRKLKERSGNLMHILRNLQKNLKKHQDQLGSLCSSNTYSLAYILALAEMPRSQEASELLEESDVMILS